MAELAQRLNELALANSNGLLNDDEYRLLRQNAFEEYSANVVVPSETPVVPVTTCVDLHVRLHTHNALGASPEPPETPKQISSPSRAKLTGVASFLSKAGGRRTPKSARETTTTPRDTRSKLSVSPSGHDTSNTTPSGGGTLKLSVMIPKLLHRKPPYIRPETPRPLTDAMNASRAHTVPPSLSLPLTLTSPTRSTFLPSTHNMSTTSLHLKVPSESNSYITSSSAPSFRQNLNLHNKDVFSHNNLCSSDYIRATILATEDELRTLIDAFQALESRTRRRIQKQRAHRLPTNTPASVNVLLEGREWREHRRIPSLSSISPRVDAYNTHLSASVTTPDLASDRTSIRSSSSVNTSLSKSRSTLSSSAKVSPSPSRNFLGPVSAGPPLSTLFRTASVNTSNHLSTPRKNSVSSMATSTTSSYTSKSGATTSIWNDSLHPPGYAASAQPASPSSGLLRSKSHLGLKSLKSSPHMFSKETLVSVSSSNAEDRSSGNADIANPTNAVNPSELEYEDDPELVDIKRRKEDLIARYSLRLEFLRAKLKSAELHERLLRK